VSSYGEMFGSFMPPVSIDVVAEEDGTQVTITPKTAIMPGPILPGGDAGEPLAVSLDRGQFVQWTADHDQDLSGSFVQSNKPVGVWGSSACFDTDGPACDSMHQQIPPVKALGSEYAAVRYPNRTNQEEEVPWRIVGAGNGTQLAWFPAKPI